MICYQFSITDLRDSTLDLDTAIESFFSVKEFGNVLGPNRDEYADADSAPTPNTQHLDDDDEVQEDDVQNVEEDE